MKDKKYIFFSSLFIFLLCFPFHFLYDLIPNPIFAIIFPVNESIWEHMKLIFTSNLVFQIIIYFIAIYKQKQVKISFFYCFVKSILEIIVYLIIFLPFYYNFGEKMWFSILLLYLVILLGQYIEDIVNLKYPLNKYDKIGIILFIIGYIIFGILTYKPIHIHLFFDTIKEKYGINDYLIK